MTDTTDSTLVTRTQQDMLEIVANLPRLDELLPNMPASSGQVRISGTADDRIPIRLNILEVKSAVNQWASHLTNDLMYETRHTPHPWKPPCPPRAVTTLAAIAHDRVGHFLNHPDDCERNDFVTTLDYLRKKVYDTCWPRGIRLVPTGHPPVPCREAEDDIPCLGVYFLRYDPETQMDEHDLTTYPDLVCRVFVKRLDDGREVWRVTGHRVGFQEWNLAVAMAHDRGTTPHFELVRGRAR